MKKIDHDRLEEIENELREKMEEGDANIKDLRLWTDTQYAKRNEFAFANFLIGVNFGMERQIDSMEIRSREEVQEIMQEVDEDSEMYQLCKWFIKHKEKEEVIEDED